MRSQWRECIIRMRFGLLGFTVEAHTHKQRRKKQTAKSYNEMHKATYERYLIHQINTTCVPIQYIIKYVIQQINKYDCLKKGKKNQNKQKIRRVSLHLTQSGL